MHGYIQQIPQAHAPKHEDMFTKRKLITDKKLFGAYSTNQSTNMNSCDPLLYKTLQAK